MTNAAQSEQMKKGNGFIAALDQSGGSTPKALKLYGVAETEYSGETEMYDLIHKMRARIIKSPAFTGEKVIGAILFEQTMDREIDGIPTATYLWDKRGVVPFLKIDKGLEAEADGCQLMKPIPGLDDLLSRAVKAGIFGTKERSVISAANPPGSRPWSRSSSSWARRCCRMGWCRSSNRKSRSRSPTRPRPRRSCGTRSSPRWTRSRRR